MDVSSPGGGKLEAETPAYPRPPQEIDRYQCGSSIGGGGRDASVVYRRRQPRSYPPGQAGQAPSHHDGSREFPAQTTQYPSSHGGTGGATRKTMGRVSLVLPEAVGILEGALSSAVEQERNSAARGGSCCKGRNASPPKQPAKVRQLKITLQELNDLNAL